MIDQLGRMAEVTGSALAREQADLRVPTRDRRSTRSSPALAASLIRVPADTIDAQIVQTLGTVAELLEADRASVIQHSPAERMMTRTHLWVRAGTPGPPVSDPQDAFPWMLARLFEARELIVLTRLDELPPEAARDRASLTLIRRHVVRARADGGRGPRRRHPLLRDGHARAALVAGPDAPASGWSARSSPAPLPAGTPSSPSGRPCRRTSASVSAWRPRTPTFRRSSSRPATSARSSGEAPALRGVVEKVRQVADTDAPVLLLGETGTGKELLARALHAHSRRRARSFVAVNCAALPAALIESELFGHEKGAFTGASHAKPGRFELADRGTLLLDEIGELEPALQAKLLRVLEDGEIQRLGSTVTRKVDVRIIAATNRDLRRDVREGRFRSDLYYRLSVFPIEVPPLRDRREDIPLLVWHFIQSRQRALNRTITKIPKTVMAALQAYEWPGNVRELQNVIERAMILSRGSVLRVEEALGPRCRSRDEAGGRSAAESLQDVERAHIVQVLDGCGWTIEGRGQAAERLGLNPSTLRNRMRKLGITRPAR